MSADSLAVCEIAGGQRPLLQVEDMLTRDFPGGLYAIPWNLDLDNSGCCVPDSIIWNTGQRMIAEGRGSLRYFPESRMTETVAHPAHARTRVSEKLDT